MKGQLAWLRPPLASADALDRTAPLIAELGQHYTIEVIDERAAHDFVWRQLRQPFDVVVHELSSEPGHAFVVPYAIHFPGVLLLLDFATDHARAIQASRSVVVGDEALAQSLAESCPRTPVVAAPLGVGPLKSGVRPSEVKSSAVGVRVGVLAGPADTIASAANRAREAGAQIEIIDGAAEELLAEADVIIAMDWPPPAGPPMTALAAMAAGKPVLVFETLVTAAWPAMDPQTWLPRGYEASADPIVVSIDPRDEEHSLVLALRRLAAEPALREQLGRAARTWCEEHATPAHAIAAWRRILDAPGLPPSPPFPGADGSEHLRSVLDDFGVTVDLL